jgi:sugar phosphate isomerase/epimerase
MLDINSYIKGIGLTIDIAWVNGDLNRFDDMLARIAATGYDSAELLPHSVDAILNGRLDRSQMLRVRQIVHRYPLQYTVHAPHRLNVGHHPDLDLQIRVFKASLDFCAEVEAGVMVYHSGQKGLERAAWGLARLPTTEELAGYWATETEHLATLADYAARRGVTIAIENAPPHMWEIATLARAGYPPTTLRTYHPAISLGRICQQIQEIGADNVGMTLDVGHAFLAAPFWPIDLLDAIAAAAPYVRHLHWHDNFGRLDSIDAPLHERLPNGAGDLHLPPGWGTIPLGQIWQCLRGYNGWLNMEIHSRYRAHYHAALDTARDYLRIPWEAILPRPQPALFEQTAADQ